MRLLQLQCGSSRIKWTFQCESISFDTFASVTKSLPLDQRTLPCLCSNLPRILTGSCSALVSRFFIQLRGAVPSAAHDSIMPPITSRTALGSRSAYKASKLATPMDFPSVHDENAHEDPYVQLQELRRFRPTRLSQATRARSSLA